MGHFQKGEESGHKKDWNEKACTVVSLLFFRGLVVSTIVMVSMSV